MSSSPLPLQLPVALAMSILIGPLASALAGCSGTASGSPTGPDERGDTSDGRAASSRLDLDDVARLDDALDCTVSDLLFDDLDFFDSMRGIDCYFADDAVLLRAYERESSVDQVLSEWLPTFTPTNQVVVGANWFAVGRPDHLVALAGPLGVATEPTSAPQLRPLPLTPLQERVGACSTTVSQLVRQTVEEPTGPREGLDDAEVVLPGIAALVDGIAARLIAEIDAEPVPDQDPERPTVGSRLSAFGPEIKQACADRFASNAPDRPTTTPAGSSSARNRPMHGG